MSYRLDDPQTDNGRWLGDQESNLDSQIQNLMSYQLDDPQKKEPQQVNACWGSYPEGRPQPAFHYVKAGYMVRCWINLIKTKDNRLFRSPQAVKCVGSHSGKSDLD
jgi:hypothetical protein